MKVAVSPAAIDEELELRVNERGAPANVHVTVVLMPEAGKDSKVVYAAFVGSSQIV